MKKPRTSRVTPQPRPEADGGLRGAASSGDGLHEAVMQQLNKVAAQPLAAGLYIVATPIGHLADITLRALTTLAAVDLILCEDTRHSRKLLTAYGLGRPLRAYHDFSSETERTDILDRIASGSAIALISDAGTPLVSDPGYKLVRAALLLGIRVIPIPGASAVLAALVASGLPSDQFHFAGFMPRKDKGRRDKLVAMEDIPGTLIFFETGPRLLETLEAINDMLPGRTLTVARELTKLHETVITGSFADIAERLGDGEPIGEIAVLISPQEERPVDENAIAEALQKALKTETLKKSVEEVTKRFDAPRNMVYNLALKLRGA